VLLVSEEDFVAKKCYCCNQPVGTYTLLQYTPLILDHWLSDFKLVQLVIRPAKFGCIWGAIICGKTYWKDGGL